MAVCAGHAPEGMAGRLELNVVVFFSSCCLQEVDFLFLLGAR